MSDLTPLQLQNVAAALATAYPGTAADALFASIGEDFEAITDPAESHANRMSDAVADVTARGCLLKLIDAVLNNPSQQSNNVLRMALMPLAQQARLRQLDTIGLVLRLGPFVNRTNLRKGLDRLFFLRRVLRVFGTTRGRTWSCQLVERRARELGARYAHADLREAPPEGRSDPRWLAGEINRQLFVPPASPPSLEGFAENRLVEALLKAWVPPADTVVVVIDHAHDQNVSTPVQDHVASLALEVAKGTLTGIRLILIDGPPDLDLSNYDLQTIEDKVDTITAADLQSYFTNAVETLYPRLPQEDVKAMVDAAMGEVEPLLAAGTSRDLGLAVRDALEEIAIG